MRAVLISIQPKWVELIANGEKTIEVRKTKPKLETPFKVYIYCTIGSGVKGDYLVPSGIQCGKVIGEFVCDRIDDFRCCSVPYKKENNLGYGRFVDNGVYKVNGWHEGVVFERNDIYIDSMLKNNDLKEMCLSAQEIFDYIGIGKHLYAWHISDLKIYAKPKELSEFRKQNFCYKSGDWETLGCWEGGCVRQELGECDGRYSVIERLPQSWCYVEELQNG